MKNEQLLIRVTFDDMINRKQDTDNFLNENISIVLKIFYQNEKLF